MENQPLSTQDLQTSSESDAKREEESEWKIFLLKIQGWLGVKTNSSDQFEKFLSPSRFFIGLVVLAIFLKAYNGILNSFDEIPLAPALFKVVGTLSLLRFSITRLLHKKDRQQFFFELSERWRGFIDP